MDPLIVDRYVHRRAWRVVVLVKYGEDDRFFSFLDTI